MTTIETNRKGHVDTSIVIVGGGPVGLTLAHILEEHRVRWILVEPRAEPDPHSRAIGVAPPTQRIFERIGVRPEVEQSGIVVRRAYIHGQRNRAIELEFDRLAESPSCIISIQQAQTESILRRSLARRAPNRLWYGARAQSVHAGRSGVSVDIESAGRQTRVAADYVCGCDGVQSLVRSEQIGRGRDYRYRERFIMGDFRDESGLGEQAHLYFTRFGSVEAFPLPGGIRRWIVQTDRFYEQPPHGLLTTLVAQRTGYALDERLCSWQSSFRIRRSFAAAMARPPVFLAGDAAHTVPPIGGQGMNLGIGDAEHLGDLLGGAYRRGGLSEVEVRGYERRRVRAVRHAGVLSIAGMRVGIMRGAVGASLRDGLLRALLQTPLSNRFMREFAMLAAPYTRSPWRRDSAEFSEANNRKHTAE